MELNAEQIKKALECLVDKYSENGSYNTYITLCDALALINSQEQRIKELEAENVQFRHEQKKLIGERDVYKTWAYNKNALINSMTDKIESGYEPSAARACAEAEMWQRIALREKELTEENERLRELATTKEVEKEIVRKETKSDTVRKMQDRVQAFLTDEETDVIIAEGEVFIPISAVRKITKEMLEENKNENT